MLEGVGRGSFFLAGTIENFVMEELKVGRRMIRDLDYVDDDDDDDDDVDVDDDL